MAIYKDLQDSMPTFVKKPSGITWAGRFYARGKEFPWKTLGVSFDTARTLFYSDQIFHSDELTVEHKVGDGLDMLAIGELHKLVETINEKVAKATKNNKSEFQRKKCKKSNIVAKQRGLIRSWRSNFGQLENE
jgi:hypothetical protein